MRSKIKLSDCEVRHWGRDWRGCDHFALINGRLLGSVTMNRVWWRDFLQDVAGRFSAEGGLKLFKVWLGPGSQDLIYVGSERGQVFLQVRRVFFGMEGDVREKTAEVKLTEEDWARLSGFISGWEAEREESERGAFAEGAEIVLSDCRVGESTEKFDRYILFHRQLLGPVRISTAFWVWILDNLERCWGEVWPEGERVCHKIWFCKGNQHFVSQVTKLKEGRRGVFLRLERVCYKEEGEVQHIRTDVPFTREDIERLRGFIKSKTDGIWDLEADWERQLYLEK